MLASYSSLANRRLYGACARLGDAERKRERPAFFGSIHGTLNHIMVGDRIWLARFAGEVSRLPTSTRSPTKISTSCGGQDNMKTSA
jgi:uncharacterized damage-inducible protein DinB